MISLGRQLLNELGDYLTYGSKVSTLVFGKAAPIPEENIVHCPGPSYHHLLHPPARNVVWKNPFSLPRKEWKAWGHILFIYLLGPI